MEYVWKCKKAFMNELLDMYPDPKPATTTVATLLKRMNDKGYIDYEQMGRSRQYFATVKKSDYFSRHLKGLIEKYFDDSPTTFASFFTRETDLTEDQLKELQDIVEQELDRRKS